MLLREHVPFPLCSQERETGIMERTLNAGLHLLTQNQMRKRKAALSC